MTTWKPGQLAMLTLRTGVEKPAVRVEPAGEEGWVWHLLGEEFPGVADSAVTRARPLVVMDPEDREQVERLAQAYHECDHIAPWSELHNVTRVAITDALVFALRSLIAPPKPEEPTGKWAVIEDGGGRCLIRSAWASSDRPWNVLGTGDYLDYADINVVRVLSQGVTP